MAMGYYRTMLAYGIKLMVTLLLAGIGLDILHNVQAQAGQGWGTDLMTLGNALSLPLYSWAILVRHRAVAGITGVSTNGAAATGGPLSCRGRYSSHHGKWTAAAAAQGGKQLGSAVRNAVKQGQALSRGRP